MTEAREYGLPERCSGNICQFLNCGGVLGYKGDGNLQHVIARQRNQLALMQSLFDKSNQQKRYQAQQERTRKQADQARRYREHCYTMARALNEIAKETGTPYAATAQAAMDKVNERGKWL